LLAQLNLKVSAISDQLVVFGSAGRLTVEFYWEILNGLTTVSGIFIASHVFNSPTHNQQSGFHLRLEC
jgi:hypothetical protein